MRLRNLKDRMQTTSSVVLVVTMMGLLVATSIGSTIAGSQELTVTPTSVQASTQAQTISYSISGGPDSLAYEIDVKPPGGSAQPLVQGTTSSTGTASGTFSDTFDAVGAYQVVVIFSNGAGSNVVDIQVASLTTTTTTSSSTSSSSSLTTSSASASTITGSQELTVTPITFPASTQAQTLSYSVAGGPDSLAYKVDVKAPGGNAQVFAQGTTSSTGTASGIFSYTFDVVGTYQVEAIFANSASSNVVDVQVTSTTTTTTTSSSSTSSSSSSTSTTASGVPTVYMVKHGYCTADGSAPTRCNTAIQVPAGGIVIVFPSTGDRFGNLSAGQVPCDGLVAPPTILSVSSNSVTWTERGTSQLTECENVANSVYPNMGFQIRGGEEWDAVASSALTLSITVTTTSATGGSLYSYELNLDVIALQGVNLSGIFGLTQPCISTGWSDTLSCNVTSSGAGFIIGDGQALNGMCAGSGFTALYHSPLAIQNVGVEGMSSSSPVSNLAVTFNQVCYDTNINDGNDIWVMTAEVIQ